MARRDLKRNYGLVNASEVAFLVLCLWIIWSQALSYATPTNDPDPDGYTSYSTRLRQQFEVDRQFRRYPGYPIFITVANKVFLSEKPDPPGGIHKPVHMLQTTVCLLFVVGFYIIVRNAFGILVAWISVAIIAFQSFLVLYTSLPFPDFIYSIGWAGCFWHIFHWVRSTQIVPSRFNLLVFILGIVLLQLIKPNATTILIFFALSLGFVIIIGAAKFQFSRELTRVNLIKCGIMSVIAVIVAILIILLFGSGPLDFVSREAKIKIVYYLPPASLSNVEMKIEAGKANWQANHGMKIEEENFLGEQHEIPFELVDRVWLQRLAAHPLQYVKVILGEFLRKHYLIVDAYVPFSANTRNALYVHIMPKSTTIESKLYRSTGLWVDQIGDGTIAIVNISRPVIRVILFWSILLIGWSQLFKNYPVFVAAMTMCMILYAILHAAMIFIDSRYMLVFAVMLYLTQAVGLASIIRYCVGYDLVNNPLLVALKYDETQDGRKW